MLRLRQEAQGFYIQVLRDVLAVDGASSGGNLRRTDVETIEQEFPESPMRHCGDLEKHI